MSLPLLTATRSVFFNAGFLDFDWPEADPYWRSTLESEGLASFTNLAATFCGLIEGADPQNVIKGLVQYENALPFGTGYTLPMALTLVSQESLLPVTAAMLAKYSCLAKYSIKRDLRISKMPQMVNRSTAWRWAIDTLLPKASTKTIFNIYHYDKKYISDPQSNATVGNLDYAVHSKAFVTDLDPANAADNALLAEIFSHLDPLFDAYGWAFDEHEWTKAVSKGGGTVFCSFARWGCRL
jgi:hypothetical protein